MAPTMHTRHFVVFCFGIVNVIFGLIILFVGIAQAAYHKGETFGAQGIWAGIFVIILGIFGILGGLRKNASFETVFLIMSILAASIVTIVVFWLCIAGMLSATSCKTYVSSSGYYTYSNCVITNQSYYNANAGLVALICIFCVIAILSASFGCCVVCKCCAPHQDHCNQGPSTVTVVHMPPAVSYQYQQPNPTIGFVHDGSAPPYKA